MKKVLVVDDTKNIRLMLTKCLELDGYEVDSASNGQEGYDKLCTGRYDLAFLDIKLPELSGTEVLRRLRTQGIKTPVIIITAYPTVKNAVECTRMGAMAYLQKPFTADRLRTVLHQIDLEAPARSAGIPSPAELLADGAYAEAAAALKAALAQDPANPVTYRLLAEACEGLGDRDTAERFRRAGEAFEP